MPEPGVEYIHCELLTFGAAELARRIHDAEISPVEVVDVHIVRIEAMTPAINALVTPMYDQAGAQARNAEEELTRRSADLPALFGVSMTVKDAFAVAGERYTRGMTAYQNSIALQDEETVRLVAGGIYGTGVAWLIALVLLCPC